jgi:predicted CXXCH cytochrome family protein
VATAALIALAIGTPMAYAAANPASLSAATDAAAATATGSATASPSGVVSTIPSTPTDPPSITPTAPSTITPTSASPTPPTAAVAAIAPATQTVAGVLGRAIVASEAYTTSGFTGTVTYVVAPDLPLGLTLDGDTGVVTGTPSKEQSAADYTITASDGTAQATAVIRINVAPSAVPMVLPATQVLKGIAGTLAASTEPLVATGFATIPTFAVSPLLPIGLTMSPLTGVIGGTPLMAQKPTDYTITADDGSDTATSVITISIKPSLTPVVTSIDAIVGTPIPDTVVVATGFPDTVVFKVDPLTAPLPTGFFLDPVTGSVSGTAAAAQNATYTTITADDGTFLADMQVVIKAACDTSAATGPECILPDTSTPTVSLLAVGIQAFTDPHAPKAGTSADSCATCHRTHTAQNEFLGSRSGVTSTTQLCYTCHDGTGATANIALQYTTAGTTNDLTTRTIYQHDPADPGTYPAFYSDEDANSIASTHFQDPNSATQSACVDCHNPHNATAALPTRDAAAADAWKPAGDLVGASGVTVVNSPTAGQAPTKYTLVGGSLSSMTLEYQLCFKCHSSYTKMTNVKTPGPPAVNFPPSQEWLDKAIEFNPANKSFHPIEAAGTNTNTTIMNASLSTATSPTTLRVFTGLTTTSTIRCSNCHAAQTVDSTGGLDQNSNAHVSTNRGILIRNYRDRVLHTSGQPYADGDFALCYTCHTNNPFRTGGSNTATDFRFHQLHVSGISDKGNSTVTNIDTDGAGSGNAICAECHFRLHSNAFPVPANAAGLPQSLTGTRLVNFSPNIQPNSSTGTMVWSAKTATTEGTCTLLCHGESHNAYKY